MLILITGLLVVVIVLVIISLCHDIRGTRQAERELRNLRKRVERLESEYIDVIPDEDGNFEWHGMHLNDAVYREKE